jgi:xylan 1,4-beta-xylosidase
MKKQLFSILLLAATTVAYGQSVAVNKADSKQTTICNPMNLSYRFCLDEPSRREAADPTMVMFKGEYYLFASKSGGYFHSTDLINWDLITSAELPLEDYAPTVVEMRDSLFFMASANAPVKIYKTANPKTGKWEIAKADFPIGMIDPDLFLDDDGRLFFYYGCSNSKPLYAVELDPKSFNPIGNPIETFNSNKADYGWEQSGDYNNQPENPWLEGSWMTKYNDRYYLQYAIPGTQFKSYCDGVYVSDKPLGPFRLSPNNPFSSKPEGFIGGAGHSSTFKDRYGNYWHISTLTISQKHMFERRLGLFPTFFDKDGTLYTYTGFGDFPFIIPQKKISSPDELFPKWMLLSYKKPVTVSSEMTGYSKSLANDEDVRTYWSAQTGNKGEWITIDLEKQCNLNAVQINYAENNTKVLGRDPKIFYNYLLEYSDDNKSWKPLADKRLNKADVPHDYIQLSTPVKGRYIRLTSYYMPDGTFSLADLRVFGTAPGNLPAEADNFIITRNPDDKREVKLKWNKKPGDVGFNIRYGSQPDKLYHNWQVLGVDTLTIRNLNRLQEYYFTIDVFNETGVRRGIKITEVK